MEDLINLSNQDFSFFAKGSKITGKFELYGPTHIAAQIEGDLFMQNESNLFLEKSCTFDGTINCHNIEIYGKFSGKLNATGKIIIYPPAEITGELKCSDMIIHPGANINISGHTSDPENPVASI